VRIAYLCADFGIPIHGSKGASIHVRELSRALAGLGHDVVIIAPRAGGPSPRSFGLPVVEVRLEPLEQLTYDLLLADKHGGARVAAEIRAMIYASTLRHRGLGLLRERRPDFIYQRYSLFGTAGLALARDLGVPLVLEVNAPLCDEQAAHRGLGFAATARALERTVLCSADVVVTVSRELEDWLIGLGVESSRITVLPNAVDVERFEAAEREREAVRTELGLAGQQVVGFLGTLKPWHDTATLIRATGILHREMLKPRLIIIGDGPEREQLAELAQREGIADATTFIGTIPHERVPGHLAALDIAVTPYEASDRFYFSPLKLFEYLAAGRPVVAADVGRLRDCVRSGETGLLYRAGDARALAGALCSLLTDPERARALGRAGREHVRVHHTWRQNARTVVELVGPMLASRQRVS
jgi:glycosyltransferase involved in cell wall biosynthesis